MYSNNTGPQIFDDADRAPARSSVFRAIMSRPHKRNQSADDAIPPQYKNSKPTGTIPFPWADNPDLPPGHLPLAEIVPNCETRSNYPSSTKSGSKDNKRSLHKKTKSAVSLKSLRNYMERKDNKPEDSPAIPAAHPEPKKTKSTNSLSAILKRSHRGRKTDATQQGRDKENRNPVDLVENMPSPVWPQESGSYEAMRSGSRHNFGADRPRSIADEVALYTPNAYSPAQQRNFCDYQQPSLTEQAGTQARMESDIPTGSQRVKDSERQQRTASGGSDNSNGRGDGSSLKGQALDRARKMSVPASPVMPPKEQANTKRLSRVQAAISAFNAKERDADVQKHLSSKDLESEFEKLLVRFLLRLRLL